ncbi:MAG: hypothetical protein IT221_11150 [Fluviicola sp.]|nr:hypothetical protein [Fluviicola sp.]
MKVHFKFFNGLFFILLIGLSSCGLKYDKGPTLEEINTNRKLSLESQLKKDYASLNKTYTPLEYGNSSVIKPLSYKRLDSLFNEKYQLTQSGLPTKQIDIEIELQRAIIAQDTNEIAYVETHWFQLQEDSLFEYIVGEFALDKQNEIIEMTTLDYFNATKSDVSMAQKYMKETGFAFSTSFTTELELEFYAFMKNRAAQLNGAEKNAFLKNVFNVMRIANSEQNLSTEAIVKKMAQIAITSKYPLIKPLELSYTINSLIDPNISKTELIEVQVKNIQSNEVIETFLYDPWLMRVQ